MGADQSREDIEQDKIIQQHEELLSPVHVAEHAIVERAQTRRRSSTDRTARLSQEFADDASAKAAVIASEARMMRKSSRPKSKPMAAEWSIQAFAASLDEMPAAVATALLPDANMSSVDQLELMTGFENRNDIAEQLRAGQLIDRVADALWHGVQKLRQAQEAKGNELTAELAAEGEHLHGVQRKKIIADLSAQMAVEVRTGSDTVANRNAAHVVQEEMKEILAEPPERFVIDVRFLEAVDEALKVKRSVDLASVLGGETAGNLEASLPLVAPLQLSVVDLSGWELQEGGAHANAVIRWMASNPPTLNKLTVDASTAGVDVLNALLDLVAITTSLTRLDVLEGSDIDVLQLNGTKPSEAIDMRGASFEAVSAAIIASCISANPHVRSVDLDGSVLSVKQLNGEEPIRTINLNGKGLSRTSGIVIAKLVASNTTSTTLNLTRNLLDAVVVVHLSETLQKNNILQTLVLRHNKLNAIAAAYLSEGLTHGSSLKELDLYDNEIGPVGAAYLAVALKENRCLVMLNLCSNGLDAKAAQHLAEGLKQNDTLTELDLEDNNIYPKGAVYLAAALKHNTALQTLSLADNAICHAGETKGMEALCAMLRINMTLQTVKQCAPYSNSHMRRTRAKRTHPEPTYAAGSRFVQLA
uniref:Uncharacterized protein n=1 Tax=Haptolina brevifila TaxID=156173 RepID=A0A7S2CJJ4_9EUKA|mmetsp:Transcript_25698/g.51602  ORF Transcript_25698/g.51602 Transcript_25698/m.51602 type:complete len:644 (+) Transcript_25698:90-2021(+)|eukprot:CAMPEP_0174705910 /NCGR_PEP_ID=MMETSP1094-20130205/8950_1 /TAXON_ID=156173 /ORGANISM="Chrysochromulina brevifilum, Strain UTEX LB 985" /LENGTH=643 /DNA_ID=CAMNT_0015904123 /DNA_START=88 /DNA_END=2019 /DNA_ORIENTATION=+